jgi:hypothetical protein
MTRFHVQNGRNKIVLPALVSLAFLSPVCCIVSLAIAVFLWLGQQPNQMLHDQQSNVNC